MSPEMKDALEAVKLKIQSMSPEELRKELDAVKSTDITEALRELQQFSDFLHENGMWPDEQETNPPEL